MLRGLPSLALPHLLGRQGRLRPLGDQAAFLFGEGRVEVQHEGIGIPAQLGYDEGHALRHQPGNERYVAGKPIIDAATIYAGSAAVFDYARQQTDILPLTVSWDDVRTSLRNARVWENDAPQVYATIDRLAQLSDGPSEPGQRSCNTLRTLPNGPL
jgi:hypothetical protein